MWPLRDSGAFLVKLDDFRRKKGWSYSELGRRLGVKRPANARRHCLPAAHAEFRMPDDSTMRKIVAVSDGQVTPNDFYELSASLGALAKKRAAA